MNSPGTTISISASLGAEHHGVSSQAIWGGQGQVRSGLTLRYSVRALTDRAWDLPLEVTCSSGR